MKNHAVKEFHVLFTLGTGAGNALRPREKPMNPNPRTVACEVEDRVVHGDDRCPICSESHRAVAPTGPERILVAEDEPCVASLIAYNLEQDGYRVTIAGDGEEALRSLAA